MSHRWHTLEDSHPGMPRRAATSASTEARQRPRAAPTMASTVRAIAAPCTALNAPGGHARPAPVRTNRRANLRDPPGGVGRLPCPNERRAPRTHGRRPDQMTGTVDNEIKRAEWAVDVTTITERSRTGER